MAAGYNGRCNSNRKGCDSDCKATVSYSGASGAKYGTTGPSISAKQFPPSYAAEQSSSMQKSARVYLRCMDFIEIRVCNNLR